MIAVSPALLLKIAKALSSEADAEKASAFRRERGK
jgi:hypothetical protein